MSGSFQKDADTYHCPVCLDILQQPVTLPCGHSYCMSCIETYWDNRGEEKGYSCPQCRETFYPRPCLRRNIVLTELVEKLRGTVKIQSDSPVPPPSCGSGDVKCDICSGKKLKAVRSCLVCMISLCETHMQSHYEVPALKKHKLVKATHMQQRMCSQHDRPLEMFCCTDQTCVCMRCAMTEHRSHHVVPPEEERREKQVRSLSPYNSIYVLLSGKAYRADMYFIMYY